MQFQPRTWNPHYGGRDNREGHSLSPEGSGPKAFRGAVRNPRFPRCFWVPSNIAKYDGKINPSVWLEDYLHVCRVGGANDDLFIIQFLHIYLAESAIAWLDHLPRNAINRFDDLWEVFTGNFQGTYVCPGNPWDLKGCQQKQGEPLRDYIQRFSQKFHAWPDMPRGRKPLEPPSLWWK
jgi:hypothetical protein